ncbi:ATP-binding protein [Gemmatimonas groenlandica]|uniref:histidine kinase n=1 Tax=Gemmatimonas groenlandica TaxID=2732249 RepID=A0A6M4IRT5_9BACT|nr:PAS domain-containing sensor histidine kinase [Gemmatimonas groenlandica]QJR36738.1 PAS domain S-box protein [Gemmatimonas groenlandica]
MTVPLATGHHAHSSDGSISGRLLVALGTVMFVSFAIVLAVVVLVMRSYEIDSLRRESVLSADRLAKVLEPALWNVDVPHAGELATAYMADQRIVSITIRETLQGESRRFGNLRATDTMLVRRAVVHDGQTIGEIDLAFDRGVYRAHLRRDISLAILVSLIVLGVSLAGLAVLVRAMLARPLDALSRVVTHFAQGDYTEAAQRRVIGSGELRHLSEVLFDMGAQIDTQVRELTETNRRLAFRNAALDAAANAIWIVSREGHIEWVNTAFTVLTGYSADEAIGQRLVELLDAEVHDTAFFDAIRQIIHTGTVWSGEITSKRKDGTVWVGERTVTPLADPTGYVAHYIIVEQDVTQRKQLEAQYRQAQKMESVGRLAGGIAHDFNNMLSVILSNAELAIDQVEPGSAVRDDLAEIQHAAQRSVDLTRQLLAFARKQDVAPRTINLNALIGESLKMLGRMVGEQVQFLWRPATALWSVRMDPSQVEQVLANLCVNARDAIQSVGTIVIATENRTLLATDGDLADLTAGDYVVINVSDTGSGMSPELLTQIFEPFFTTKSIGLGTGLGLSTVYGIVAQNGGAVRVSSTVGQGTHFAIYLPRYTGEEDTEVEVAAVSASTTGTETVLVVEDEAMVLAMAVRILTANGYRVLAAGSADAAIHTAQSMEGPLDLLLTDVIMPKMAGPDVARAIGVIHPQAVCVFMSGFAEAGGHTPAPFGDSALHVSKPFTPSALAGVVRRALDTRSLAQSAARSAGAHERE